MTEEEFAELIARGREQASVEFKGPGLKTDKHLFAKVTRAVLGMANLRYGGRVVVGIEEQQADLVLTGLTPEQLSTWKYDDLADSLAPYADPSVEFDTEVIEYKGRRFLVIRVEEFLEVPVLCKKGYSEGRDVILRDGACYIRPRRKPETIEVGTYADMRDLIELATDKGLRRFIARAQAAGIPLIMRKEESDEDLFEEQADAFYMEGVMDKIKSRGYWRVIIRPSDFRQDRIPDFETLKHIITQSSVSLRGWSFPHVSTKTDIQVGLDCVQQWVEWSDHVEAWRFYQSGQFIFYGSNRDDWRDQSFWRRPGEDSTPGALLSVIDVVFRFAEIFEFAARLAMSDAGSEAMTVCINLVRLKERQLWFQDEWGEGFDYPRIAHIDYFPQEISVSRQELVADPRLLSLKASTQLFMRFDWTPSIEFLRGVQNKLGR